MRLGNTTAGGHEDRVEEIGVTIVELTTNLSKTTTSHRTERLFLTGGDVTKDTDVLRENVLSGTENSDRGLGKFLVSGSVRVLVRDVERLEFTENATDFEALFEVVVLVGIDKLNILAAVEDDGVVLVVGLSITENGVTGKLDAELGTNACRWRGFQSDHQREPRTNAIHRLPYEEPLHQGKQSADQGKHAARTRRSPAPPC